MSSDPIEMEALMLESVNYKKPLYIRIGRSVDPIIHRKLFKFKIGKAIEVEDGKDAVIFVTGIMLKTATEVYEKLKGAGIFVSLYSMPTVKPIDEEVILNCAVSEKHIFTIEEHSVIGGLGDAVARVLIEYQCQARLKKIGVLDKFVPVTGSRDYLDDFFGISTDKIVETIIREMS